MTTGTLLRGDVTLQHVDAVVDAANSSPPGRGGVNDAYRDAQRVREVSQRFGQAASASAKVVGAKFQVKPFPQV